MNHPQNEAARPELARAADKAEAGNLKGNHSIAASKTLFAAADASAALIPYCLTTKRKEAAIVRLCEIWLAALAASRAEMGI